MIPCQRHLFDIPDEIAYFNCSYLSPLMHSVGLAGEAGVARKSHPWKIFAEHFFNESEIARGLFAQLIDASADDVAIIPSASYGIEIAAANIDIQSGEEIVVLKDQFPSNVYPWYELAKQNGARLNTVTIVGSQDWTSAIMPVINEKTKIVTLPQVHWTDGSLVDLEPITKKCREVGAVLVLDLTQSIGALPFSIQSIQPDFVVCSAYKWLLGPYSFTFLYVSPKFQNGRPIENAWMNRENSEDFAGLVNYRDEFQKGARRFDVGERSNFALTPMVVAALNQILEWQVPKIQETLSAITNKIVSGAMELGIEVASSNARAGHILGLRFASGLVKKISQRLKEENIFVSIRGDAMRISPHLYNNEEDVARLLKVLAAAI